MKKILVLTDFSAATQNASEYAALLAKAFGAELYLLHVYTDLIPATVGPEPWSVTMSGLQNKYEALMKKEIIFLEERCSIKVNGEVKKGSKNGSVNQIASDMAVDLIVLGRKSGKKREKPGSISLKLIRKTKIPVLMIPENVVFSSMKNIVLAVNFNEIADDSCFEPLFRIVKIFDASLRVLHVEKRGADINPAEMPGKLLLGRDLSKVSYLYDRIEYNGVDQGIEHFVEGHPTDLLVMVAHQRNVFEQLFGPDHIRSVNLEITLPLLILKDRD